MKANTKKINYVKMLRHCIEHLGNIAETTNDDEFLDIKRAYSILLDTNILYLTWYEMNDILEKLEAKEITNSQAEKIAKKYLCNSVRPSIELEQRLADSDDNPDVVMQLFFGRDCRWTEGFDELGNTKGIDKRKTFNNNRINL